MINPMTNDEIEELVGLNEVDKNMLKTRKNGIPLTDNQVNTLAKYNIDSSKAKDMKELLYMIEEVDDADDDDELSILADEISELDYYMNTRQ